MEHKDVMMILDNLEQEERVREARLRGFARIREVIIHYKEVQEQLPNLERNLQEAQKTHKEVSERLNNQLAGLRSQAVTGRKKLEEENILLEKELTAIRVKREEAQVEYARIAQESADLITSLNAQTRQVEERHRKAVADFEAFKRRVAV